MLNLLITTGLAFFVYLCFALIVMITAAVTFPI
jgi:hypothetical protein